jgi:uncharacterized membrane protein
MKNIKEFNVKTVTYMAILIALSFIGSLIKIQGSIAFDSMPGYFAAIFLGPYLGGIVALLGHLLTAITSGFPLTIPMHIIVALEMFVFAYVFSITYKRYNPYIATGIVTILNGPIAALIASAISILFKLPLNGWPLFYAVVIPLTIASFLNSLIAVLIYRVIKQKL